MLAHRVIGDIKCIVTRSPQKNKVLLRAVALTIFYCAVAQKGGNYMRQELYEKALENARSNGIVLANYEDGKGVPHYLWTGWKYMPDRFGLKLLNELTKSPMSKVDFCEQLRKSRIYEMKPFVVDNADNAAMFMGEGVFLRYNNTENCFTVSRYPDGYVEIDRNCFPWGKLLKHLDITDGTVKTICSEMIWYNFYELCCNSEAAFVSAQCDEETTYDTLADFVFRATGFQMTGYRTMKISNYMGYKAEGLSEHIKLCGGKVYNIANAKGDILARFCYNKSTIIVEWKDGKTKLSTIAELHIPNLKLDDGAVVQHCMAGFLASNKIKVGWHSAYTWNNAVELIRINARDVMVNSMEDVIC